MNLEQLVYSFLPCNFHYQNIEQELCLLREFLQHHRVHAKTMIDVGCGDGAVTVQLQALFDLGQVQGIDVNEALLSRARRRGIITWCGDAVSMALGEKFDMAVSYGSLHHFANTRLLIESMKWLTRRYILIVDNTIRRNFWFHRLTGSPRSLVESSPHGIRSTGEIIKTLEKCGCRVIGSVTFKHANIWHDRSFFLARI